MPAVDLQLLLDEIRVPAAAPPCPVRAVVPADRHQLHRLFCDAFFGTPDFEGLGRAAVASAAEGFLAVYFRAANRGALPTSFVALEDGGRCVGAALTQHAQAGGVLLDMLAVAPGFRRRGIARALLAEVVWAEKKRGTAILRSRVFPENRPSWCWHRQAGFREAQT